MQTFYFQANNNEVARYHYYMGRIKGIQLEYSEAHKHLIQALRKAPQQTAVGFRQSVQKLAVVVELLLGDIPERQVGSWIVCNIICNHDAVSWYNW